MHCRIYTILNNYSGCQPADISSICYERSHLTSQDPVKDVKSFFTSPIPTWPEVHWITIRSIISYIYII